MIKIKLVQVSKFLFKLSKLLIFSSFIFFWVRFLDISEIISPSGMNFFLNILEIAMSLLYSLIILIEIPLFIIVLYKYIIFKLSKKEDLQKQSEIKKSTIYLVRAGVLTIVAVFIFRFASIPLYSIAWDYGHNNNSNNNNNTIIIPNPTR